MHGRKASGGGGRGGRGGSGGSGLRGSTRDKRRQHTDAGGMRRDVDASKARGRVNRRDVADRLHSAAIHLLRTLRKTDTSTGISSARLSALSVLVFGGPRSLGELAETEQVTSPTMSRIVAGLESDGYISRRPDRHDQRAIQLRSTAKGKAALERGRRLRIESLTKLLQSASKAELATLSDAARLIEEAVAAQ